MLTCFEQRTYADYSACANFPRSGASHEVMLHVMFDRWRYAHFNDLVFYEIYVQVFRVPYFKLEKRDP